MRTKTRKPASRLSITLLSVLLAAVFMLPPAAHAADGDIALRQDGAASGYEDGRATLTIRLANSTDTEIAGVSVTADSTSFYIADSEQTVTVPASGTATVTFRIDLGGVTAGYYTVPVTAEWDTGTDSIDAGVRVRMQEPEEPETYNPAIRITHSFSSSEGIVAGRSNELALSVQNKGDASLSALEVTLSSLPDGLTLDNAGTSFLIGSLSKGSTKKATFPILADDTMKSGSYPIGITVTARDPNGGTTSFTQTLYVPVKASGSQFLSAVSISGITLPAQAKAGDSFTLSFQVANSGSRALENVKVTASGSDGIINKTKNIFIQPSIAAGGSASFSIDFYIPAKSEEKYYPIEITVLPASGSDAADNTVTQYTGVYVGGGAGAKTPQLIVERYGYGGSFVQAGDNVDLSLTLYNTSARDLQNIKITLTAEDGTFIPYNSSNSFYISAIPKNSKTTKTVTLSVKPTAEQKTSAINVKMSYEDGSGNAFDAEDIISIPVMQETRLVVDDIIAPPDLYAGQPMSVSVQFYNMGKTVLNNLRVTAEGNFTATESTNYFVGNMEAGKNDYYDFGFMPNEPGQMTGSVIFTFEDQAGNEQVMTKEFVFDVMEMPIMPEDPGMIPPEEPGPGKLPWILGGIAAAAAITGFVIFRRIRKKRKEKAMEVLDEQA